MNNSKLNTVQPQMELGFGTALSRRAPGRRSRRLRSARWWFDQMRQVVDQALERQPKNAGRPEQIYLLLDRRAQLN
ncbi:MAG: hypothetical protein AB9869_30235 [Verrucomicrobiia bacterium]